MVDRTVSHSLIIENFKGKDGEGEVKEKADIQIYSNKVAAVLVIFIPHVIKLGLKELLQVE